MKKIVIFLKSQINPGRVTAEPALAPAEIRIPLPRAIETQQVEAEVQEEDTPATTTSPAAHPL